MIDKVGENLGLPNNCTYRSKVRVNSENWLFVLTKMSQARPFRHEARTDLSIQPKIRVNDEDIFLVETHSKYSLISNCMNCYEGMCEKCLSRDNWGHAEEFCQFWRKDSKLIIDLPPPIQL